MSLVLPYGTFDDINQAMAAIQAWANGIGKWIDVAYDVTNFRAESSAGLWTVEKGDAVAYQYCVLQDFMVLQVQTLNTSTNATPGSVLRVKIPGGYKAVNNYLVGKGYFSTATVFGDLVVYGGTTTTGFDYVRLLRDILPASTAFPGGETNTLNVGFTAFLRVVRQEGP